ncbi:MAG: general secretion pathway protein GspB [Xanthomonadales bacterium]
MSMLLDALRKSEEQRRLGAQPDIHRTPDAPPPDAGEPLRQWLPVALIVVSALVMAWFGWQQFQPPSEPAAIARDATQARGPEQPAAPGGTPSEAPRTPVEAYAAPQSPAAETTADEGSAASGQRTASLQDISEFKAPPGETAPSGKPSPESVAAASQPASAPEPKPKPAARSEPGATAARDASYEPRVMTYWELPQGVRDSLPPFRISVIVYADDPANRFLLVNGVRLQEGDELQGGVVLEEIRRDGAIFRARNYRFLVKG